MKYFTSECDPKYIDPYLKNSNRTRNSSARININVPLPILIKQMLDEVFGKRDSANNVSEDQCNDENKNCEVYTSLQTVQDTSVSTNNEPNDCSSLHESVSNFTKHKNDKLISIEEEDTNSSHNLHSIEYTGTYLSRLLKSKDKWVNRIKHDNLSQSQSDTEISSSQIDTDISTKDSLCHTTFVSEESSISQQSNDDRNESVMTVNTNHSFNDADDSSNNDNTAEFFNFLQKENSSETKCDPKYIDPYLKNSNRTRNSSARININVPLPILIKQMLDEVFGKRDSANNVTGDQCNNENKNCEVYTSLQTVQDTSVSTNNEPNDCSSLHESVSNFTKHKNDKLISIEEEDTNSSHNLHSIEYTGTYLSRLLKSNDKWVNQIKHDNPSESPSDTEISSSQIDTDISTKDSFCHTTFVSEESSISQQSNDDRNESVMTVNTNHSFNDADDSSNNDNTAEFLNFFQKENSPKTKEVFCESQSLLKEDRTEFSIDASLVNIDHSVQDDTPLFISTLNLRRRTPSSLIANNKLFKTPCYNTTLAKKQVHYRSGFYMKAKKTGKTSKSSIYPNGAKPFKSRDISKRRRMIGPRIVFTPATPKSIS